MNLVLYQKIRIGTKLLKKIEKSLKTYYVLDDLLLLQLVKNVKKAREIVVEYHRHIARLPHLL